MGQSDRLAATIASANCSGIALKLKGTAQILRDQALCAQRTVEALRLIADAFGAIEKNALDSMSENQREAYYALKLRGAPMLEAIRFVKGFVPDHL